MMDISGENEKDIMAALLHWGPLVTIVEASELWQYHNGTGIIKAHQCPENIQNHAVVITGYDFSGPTPFYWIKNSWSNDWGEEGYAKLHAGKNACNVAKSVVAVCAKNCNKIAKDPKQFLFNSNVPHG
jgi:cathepsin F